MKTIRMMALLIILAVNCSITANAINSLFTVSQSQLSDKYIKSDDIHIEYDNDVQHDYENIVFGEKVDSINYASELLSKKGNVLENNSEKQNTRTSNSSNGYLLPDGIYALRNKKHTYTTESYWMDIRYNSTLPGKNVQLYKFNQSPARSYSASGLYKITHVENTENRYIIRLMLNEELTFGFVGDDVKTKTISLDDSLVSDTDTFIIEYVSSSKAYTIKPYGQSYYVSAQDDPASGSGAGDDSILKKRTKTSAGTAAEWVVEGYKTDVKEGVYALKNCKYQNMWLDIRNNSYSPGAILQQYNFGYQPTLEDDRSGLFKISKVEVSDGDVRYVVRLMTNNLLTPSIDSVTTYVYTSSINSKDSYVSSSMMYFIVYDTNGYVLQSAGGNYDCISAQVNASNSSGASEAPKSNMIHKSINNLDDYARWELYECNSSFSSVGYTITNIAHNNFLSIGTGNVYTRDVFYTTYIDAAPSIFYIYQNSLYPVTVSSYTNGATITTEKYTSFDLWTEYYDNKTSTFIALDISTFYIVPDDARYYLQNCGSNLYADITGPSMNTDTLIHQWSFHAGSWDKWEIERAYNTSGYVRIKSPYSSLYLATTDDNTVIQKVSDNSKTLWKIENNVVGDGLKFINKYNNKILAVPDNNNNKGANLYTKTQSTINDTDYNRWNLQKCKYITYLNHYYDNGFSLRWQNSNLNPYTMVDNFNDSIAKVLFDVFSLEVRANISSFVSAADNAKPAYTGGDVYTYLSQNTTVTREGLQNNSMNGNNITTTVIWTGHILRDNNGLLNPSSCHIMNSHTIIITPKLSVNVSSPYDDFGDNDLVYTRYKSTLLHELGHSFDLKDHYCYNPGGDTCSNENCDEHVYGFYNRVCIMKDSYYVDIDTVNSCDLFCGEDIINEIITHCCVSDIYDHLDNHHKQN